MDKEQTPKVNWDAYATRAFCEICKEQTEAGNRPTVFLSSLGYKTLAKEFFEKTGRSYTKRQFKNRWDAIKALYGAWIYFTDKATGLGWDCENNTVTADDAQWAEMLKANKLIEGFRRGPPDNLESMEVMFAKAHVSGKSSVMPGVEVHNVPEELLDLDEEEEVAHTPSVAIKRGAARIASSPKKNKKNPMQKDFKRWVDHCISEDRSITSTSNVHIANDIATIMEQVVQCGALEGSDEYYMATKLFGKLENQSFFYAMKTSAGRLNWLKRQYEERRRN